MMVLPILIFVVGALLSQASCHPNSGRYSNVGIVGGHQISIKSAPYMASLWYQRKGEWHQICGGSIVQEQYILTAARCIQSKRLSRYRVNVGTDKSDGTDGDVHEVEQIIIHHNYDPDTDDKNFDICMLKLTKTIVFGPNVALIRLGKAYYNFGTGTKFNVTGWGISEFNSGKYPKKLHQVQVPFVDDSLCETICEQIDIKKTSNLMCAGSIGRDACEGDEGGPLTLGDVQIGVATSGYSCGVTAGIYVKVSVLWDWIDENMN